MLNLINLLVSADVWWGLPKKLEFLKTIVNVVESVLWPILIVVATIGTIYAVYLGINMAKAEEAGKRDEAKKHIITVVTAMAITVVMILAINLIVIPNIPGWVAGVDQSSFNKIAVYTTGTASDFDEKSEVEELLGSPWETNDSTSTYRVKVDGQNYEVVIEYNADNQITKVDKNAK